MYHIDDHHSVFGRALLADHDIPQGEVVLSLHDCDLLTAPTRYSVQTGGDRHVDHPVLARVNHSCSPNLFVDVRALEAVTMREVARGETLTFFYPSTEWAMSHPFLCRCGSEPCLGQVAGAAFVPQHVLARHRLNDHIREMLELRVRPERTHVPVRSVV